MKILILLSVIYVCLGDHPEPRDESGSEESALENEDINNVYGDSYVNKVKTILNSEHKTRVTEQLNTVTLITADDSQKQSDTNFESYTTVPSTERDKKVQSGTDLIGSATGTLTRKQIAQQDSRFADIPADELIPLSTVDHNFPSESNTEATTKEITVGVDREPTTIFSTISQSEDAPTTTEGPKTSSYEEGTTSSPSESSVQAEETSEQPSKTSQVTAAVTDIDRRKTPGFTYLPTKSVPPKDTPVYPLFPTRPHAGHGQLEIKISIPNIFHLSLGDTPDGRRRLGIHAPFFKFDLTKPRFKVFQK